ncbi:MAG: EFR1 family ferrodoxin [Clostridium sp.]|uniref:EFR1 family ferrodoxin n=1 Tax=Clostridium sp. TaxID=1506 RepID=UPI0039EB6252
MVIEKDTILYFSGTGNSLQVAKDIRSELGEIDLCGISSLIDEKEIKVNAGILGIVFPVYYARLPLIVERIVKNLKFNKGTYIFAAATHGGAPAEALIKLKDILQNNGGVLNSGFLIHMPGNHIFAYNPSAAGKYDRVFQREKTKVKEISDIIRQGKDYKCEVSKLIIDRIIDRVFIKITDRIMDSLHVKDKKFWVKDNCNGCKICERICPVNNIEFNTDNPIWKHNCEQCTACIQYCPNEAIQWDKKTINRRRYRNPNVDINELI